MLVSRQLNTAYWALRAAFGFGPLLAGLDKFTNILVNVGLAILFGMTRVFGYIAMLWLFGIAANLISTGTYYDIAVRDILPGIVAYSLARVTEARQSVVYVEHRGETREAA